MVRDALEPEFKLLNDIARSRWMLVTENNYTGHPSSKFIKHSSLVNLDLFACSYRKTRQDIFLATREDKGALQCVKSQGFFSLWFRVWPGINPILILVKGGWY